jgi:hypothetical protein
MIFRKLNIHRADSDPDFISKYRALLPAVKTAVPGNSFRCEGRTTFFLAVPALSGNCGIVSQQDFGHAAVLSFRRLDSLEHVPYEAARVLAGGKISNQPQQSAAAISHELPAGIKALDREVSRDVDREKFH